MVRPAATFASNACAILAVLFAGWAALADTAGGGAASGKIEQLVRCFRQGEEAVLFRDRIVCTPYQNGIELLRADQSLRNDAPNTCDDPTDARNLPGSVVKQLLKVAPSSIDPTGIRLIGATICEPLDLIGVDLPYSLVMDHTIFMNGINARNFHTAGDLSLDEATVLGELFMARSKIDGSVFSSSSSFIDQARFLDSKIGGSLLLRKSLFVKPAIFDTVAVAGELSLHEAAFPYVLLQYSKVAGVFDLRDSRARCAYHIKQSEVRDLVVVDAGFGTGEASAGARPLLQWRDPDDIERRLAAAGRALGGTAAPAAAADKHCNYSLIAATPGTFLLADTHVTSSLCLRGFHWLSGRTGTTPPSFVTLNDVAVDTAAAIDLVGDRMPTGLATLHNFDVAGLSTGALIFNFGGFAEDRRAYQLSVSGLSFQKVYATGAITCDYDPVFAQPDPQVPPNPTLPTVSKPSAVLHVPRVGEVMSWLNQNSLATTQPFSAFVEVFEKDGREGEAKDLRIAKASTELCLKAQRIFGAWICQMAASPNAPPQLEQEDLGGRINAIAAVAFGTLLWLLADHGFHPEKVGWFVLLTIIGFALYFWLRLKIVGVKVKDQDTILPVGILFLFDRLLPLYQIREEHYRIAGFYRRVARTEPVSATTPTPVTLTTIRYVPLARLVVEAGEAEAKRAEQCLVVLRAVGLILAIFLVAAINALVSH